MSITRHDRISNPIGQVGHTVRRKQQSQQPRQLLSCTKCRERKVKCDRTKPCSACCARGAPKECHFVAEGGDYAPIQQSYELRKLRAENVRLKERLRTSRASIKDDDSDQSSESQHGDRSRASSIKRRAARQKKFQSSEGSNSIYFGSPGLANVIADFATFNLTPTTVRSLAHLMPRGPDMYTFKSPSSYPFATLFSATPEQCIPQLLNILPARRELMEYLASFAKRVHICAFPYIPIELTESEIERFLSDSERNARLCPDMLALIFAAIALGAQHSICDNSGERWKVQSVDTEAQRGNVYIAASMQALRISSFMHKPSLLAIESLVMIGPFLTNSGRFLDAWALFGTTIRLAQAIGLHRHPKYLNPAPLTQRECSTRQTLWWWMLHMDEQYSMTLGRPLGISGMGDCPPPHELTTDPQMLRFGEFIHHFTILARQILSGDQLTNAKIDGYTDLLNGLLETMPEMLQFNESWIEKGDELLEWPLSAMAAVYYCKTHTYLILLNRQRTDNHSDHSQTPSAKMPSFRSVNVTSSSHPSPDASTQTSLRGRPLVLKSSEEILVAFLFFYKRAPALLISWTISQQAFNSSMILLLDALETGNLMYIARVQQTYAIFVQLQKNGIHKLAALAVEKLSWGLVQLGKNMEAYRVHQPSEKIVSEQTVRGEADRVTSAFKDTVMSNTGMLLLEESDLQSNAPEHFMPFTWAMPSDQSGITAPSSLKQEQELQSHGKANHMASTRLDDSNETAPIVNELQHNAESPQRSALGQCYAPTSQEYCRLQCRVTGPASSTSFAAPVLQRDHNGGNSTIEQSPPLGLHHFVPPASLGDKSRMRYVTERNEGTDPSQRWNQPVQSPKQHHTPVAKFRHNSFPSLHELTTTPSSLRPTYSSPVVNEAYTSTGIERYNAHSQWPASPAGSIRDNSELGTATSPMSDQKHVVLALHHVSARQQQTTGQCPLPAHSTDARFESVIAENLEQVTGDQWKQWVGNGGSGRRYGSSYFAS